MRKKLLMEIGLIDNSEDLSVEKRFESIPYIKELRKLETVSSINACLVMAKLELLFLQYPESFCKYTRPCKSQEELDGLSWREELGMSRDAFRTVKYALITRYRTKRAYLESKDKFNGKFYCCYVDTIDSKKTYFFRNDELVDRCLSELLENSIQK